MLFESKIYSSKIKIRIFSFFDRIIYLKYYFWGTYSIVILLTQYLLCISVQYTRVFMSSACFQNMFLRYISSFAVWKLILLVSCSCVTDERRISSNEQYFSVTRESAKFFKPKKYSLFSYSIFLLV